MLPDGLPLVKNVSDAAAKSMLLSMTSSGVVEDLRKKAVVEACTSAKRLKGKAKATKVTRKKLGKATAPCAEEHLQAEHDKDAMDVESDQTFVEFIAKTVCHMKECFRVRGF